MDFSYQTSEKKRIRGLLFLLNGKIFYSYLAPYSDANEMFNGGK